MTYDEFNGPFGRLQDAFEHHVSDGTARLYYDLTRGYPVVEWQRAVEEVIGHGDRYWPRASVLLKLLRGYAIERRECEQREREQVARSRVASPPGGVPVDTGLFPPVLRHALADKMAGRITQEELERISRAWAAEGPPGAWQCRTCEDTGRIVWDERLPDGNRHSVVGRCRCRAGDEYVGHAYAPMVMQP